MKAASLLAILIAVPLPVLGAAGLPAAGTFLYSNACQSEGGDFGNYRVTVRRGGAFRVTVEFNDAGPDGRSSGKDVAFDPASGQLRFSYRGASGEHHFTGVIGPSRLQGRFDGMAMSLPRLRKIPKELPDC